MTNTETLKTYNEWRRGADIPQPSPADIGNAIDGVLSELDELKQSVGILASFPLKIRLECRKRIKDANGDEFAAMVLDSASAALNRSSGEQALADIKADAESKGAIKLLSGLTGNVSNLIKDAEDSGNQGLLLCLMFMQRMIEEYANKLKGDE